MEKSEWLELINKAKSFGLNHFRFHSWCPPEAAFEAADEAGFYFQVELPHWSLRVNEDPATSRFLEQEAERLLEAYGNHPSFLLMALGNELQGDAEWMNSTVRALKEKDPRHLYMTTTFSFQRPLGTRPEPQDDYFVTQWTDKGWIRGQGVFNDQVPHFNKDYSSAIDHISVPVISHEIGQYAVFPDMKEIERYTGVLKPLNFIAVKNELEKKGLAHLAQDFTMASGKLAAILYKEEIERALKTPGFDGFQLLQLQDFPGQGTALVGLVNAFWESKGIITPGEFRNFSGPVVPLLRFDKAVYEAGETFKAAVEVANFKEEIKRATLKWKILNEDKELASGELTDRDIPLGNATPLGSIRANLQVSEAARLSIHLTLGDSLYTNQWNIWVYPAEQAGTGDIVYTRSLQEAQKALQAGEKVLLNPDYNTLTGVKGRFVPVFWSPVHFPDQPSTMGILCDPAHLALADFPTDFHTDWQWWDLNIHSKAIPLDGTGVDPIVRVVDNFVSNRSLGAIFEASVGSGKLLFTSIDLATDLSSRHAARQLRNSLIRYMQGSEFQPNQAVEPGVLSDLVAPVQPL